MDTFSVIVPTHNDEDVIAGTIRMLADPFAVAMRLVPGSVAAMKLWCSRHPYIKSAELIVVMDGCVDNTEDQALNALRNFPFPHKVIIWRLGLLATWIFPLAS